MRRFDENLIAAFTESTSAVEIMRKTGISRTKYYRLLNDKDFQTAVTKRRNEIITAAVLRMEGYLEKDVEVLQQIIESDDVAPQTRVNAISTLMTQLAAWKVNTDFEQRLIELEELKNDAK